MPDCSVIIPSYQSWPLIAETLRALEQQTFTGSREVLVIDTTGDDTPERIQAAFPAVQVLAPPGPLYPGAARNRGLDIATGTLIAFIDADAVPAPDWLETIWDAHQKHPEYSGIGGSIGNANQHAFIARIAHLLEFSGYTPAWPPREARVIPTCNLSFKREVLTPERRFLEATWGNEDVELVAQLRAAGARIWFNPSQRVAHYSKTDFGRVLAQQRKLGHSTAQVRRHYPLPGAWLARVPGAWLLTPLIKAGILWRRALTHEPGAIGLLLVGSPWIACALGHWMWGFRAGLIAPLPEFDPPV